MLVCSSCWIWKQEHGLEPVLEPLPSPVIGAYGPRLGTKLFEDFCSIEAANYDYRYTKYVENKSNASNDTLCYESQHEM